ncbi:Uncharacterised protein [Clostridium putrefaciens]|uniref:Uncharacterized protein n=1 Tax=Clostridium putrefaciens TaxID=99675 RepID=A0A381J6B5_9CLOT|nr:hypothetical protein [Clostridium putrefaciens]SUY45304.1 Uncharacterised protein [Clostridium putrefaciens]
MMDYGTVLLSAFIAIYFIIKYSKDQKGFNLAIAFICTTGMFYRKTFGIYNNVGNSAQTIINIIYRSVVLILLAVYFINEKSKRKKANQLER